jgi:hypothetical protein
MGGAPWSAVYPVAVLALPVVLICGLAPRTLDCDIASV